MGKPTKRARAAKSPKLTPFELGAIASLLADAARDYRDYSCNDYWVPATAENRRVIAAALRHPSGDRKLAPEDEALLEKNKRAGSELYIWDNALMDYLAHRAGSAGTVPLSGAELAMIANLLDMLADDEPGRYQSAPGCEDFAFDANPSVSAYLAAVVEHFKPKGWQKRVRALRASTTPVSVFAVEMLRFLALRCRNAVALPAPVQAPSGDTATRVPRLGLAKHWPTEQRIVQDSRLWHDKNVAYFRETEAALTSYTTGGSALRADDKAVIASGPPSSNVSLLLSSLFSSHLRHAALALFSRGTSADALPHLAKAVAYRYWGQQLDVHRRGFVDPQSLVWALAGCLHLGHMPQARSLTQLLGTPEAMDKLEMETELLIWLASVAMDFWKVRPVRDPAALLEDPPMLALYRHWRDADLGPLTEELLWLCDLHTRRVEHGLYARVPFLVLAWFRLREASGLRNPSVDHPLLKASYAQLPAPQEMYGDARLEATIARLRQEEFPRLGDPDLTHALRGQPS